MSLDRELNKRSGGQCELCAATENLKYIPFYLLKKAELTKVFLLVLHVLTKLKIRIMWI
jgi:protein PhnA